MMRDNSEYVMPVFARGEGADGRWRFVGTSFFVQSPRTLVSCRHVLESSTKGQDLYVHHFMTTSWHRISDVWLHPRADIAVASVHDFGAKVMTPFSGPLSLGGDVSAFAYMEDSVDGTFALLPSVAKGYIVNQPAGLDRLTAGLGTYTLSFPSLPGFSGSPVEIFDTSHFVGMLFNNKQTEVTVSSYEERQDGGSTWKERVVRLQEYGVMVGYGEILAALRMRERDT